MMDTEGLSLTSHVTMDKSFNLWVLHFLIFKIRGLVHEIHALGGWSLILAQAL